MCCMISLWPSFIALFRFELPLHTHIWWWCGNYVCGRAFVHFPGVLSVTSKMRCCWRCVLVDQISDSPTHSLTHSLAHPLTHSLAEVCCICCNVRSVLHMTLLWHASDMCPNVHAQLHEYALMATAMACVFVMLLPMLSSFAIFFTQVRLRKIWVHIVKCCVNFKCWFTNCNTLTIFCVGDILYDMGMATTIVYVYFSDASANVRTRYFHTYTYTCAHTCIHYMFTYPDTCTQTLIHLHTHPLTHSPTDTRTHTRARPFGYRMLWWWLFPSSLVR